METWVNERIAEKIYELVNKGLSKEEIIIRIERLCKNLNVDVPNDRVISDAVDYALSSIQNNSFHAANKDVLSKLDRADKLSYVGKDGRKYYTRADLAMANEAYINDKYPTTNRVL